MEQHTNNHHHRRNRPYINTQYTIGANPNSVHFTDSDSTTTQQPKGITFSLSWEQTAIIALIVVVVALLVAVALLWRKISAK